MKEKVIVKDSNIQGKGVFANQDFKKGEIILKWDPLKLQEKDLDKYPKKYIILVDKKYFLMQSPEKYINHSCEPNAKTDLEAKGDRAIRDIKKGEEITIEYQEDNFSDNPKCNCGSKNCKGFVR
jgi:uncharacterized protein